MKISFVVLTYNRADALLAVLRSLAAQCDERHEVLIADDGSRLEEIERMIRQCPAFSCPVFHMWHPDTGFTAARCRNLAAARASGDYLVFLDGDCVPNRHFVRAHAQLAETGCFVNGSRVLLSEKLSRRVIQEQIFLPGCPSTFWLGARLRGDSNKLLHLLRWAPRLFRVKQRFDWRGIRSCNFGVWTKDFVGVNGFDEVFAGWGHEDADLVLRLTHAGLLRKNGFMATEVFHLWHPENSRGREAENKRLVLQRMKTNLVLAQTGLRELNPASPVKFSRLH